MNHQGTAPGLTGWLEAWSRRDTFWVIGLGLVFFLLYAQTRSCAPDDWDSIQFIFGMDEFNLMKHQPHPPGYPLYVASGWFVRACTGWDNHVALTLVSAMGGGVLVASIYALARLVMPRGWALPGTMVVGFTPVFWMYSIKAMSDVPASSFFLAVVLFATAAWLHRRPACLIAAAILAGLAGGFRPQNSLVLIWLVVLASTRFPKTWRLVAPTIWVLTSLCWLIPTMAMVAHVSGGHFWTTYWEANGQQFRWRFDKPNIYAGAALGQDPLLVFRLIRHAGACFIQGLAPFGHPLFFLLAPAILAGWWQGVVWSGCQQMQATRGVVLFSLQWMVPYALMVFFFLPSEQRYYIPVLAPLMLLAVAGGCFWLSGFAPRFRSWIYLAPVLFAAATLPFAWQNHTEPPPPIRSIDWLSARVAPADRSLVVFVPGSAGRHLEFLKPGFRKVTSNSLLEQLPGLIHKEGIREIYTDIPDLPQAAGRPDWVLVPQVEFRRSQVIHPKHSKSVLYRLEGWR
ncbi:MAG: DUF2723 domain-containing protein [Candidatus Methylacidiphilales bacterium]|nr:DUF2723 domain-containing protein [Candidatus Methylacidiphilales bacterium]